MKQTNNFLYDMLDFDLPKSAHDTLWLAGRCKSVSQENGFVILTIPFYPQDVNNAVKRNEHKSPRLVEIVVRAYGDNIIRVSAGFADNLPDDSVMLNVHPSIKPVPLSAVKTDAGWDIYDNHSAIRMCINTESKPGIGWYKSDDLPQDMFEAAVYPDGRTEVPFMAYDTFCPKQVESLPLAFIENNGQVCRWLFSFHTTYNEKFAGTGERFAPMNLAGKTITLGNNDALGVNSRRAYKNVPFYLSSRGYGLLMHTSAFIRLSLADISTRAAQGLIEEGRLDLFLIGGGSIEQIVHNYRKLTGFPPELPFWSYGMWMSRMTYFTADEVRRTAEKLRSENFPCDVLHIDPGWFEKPWVCDWEFGKENFPHPEKFLKDLKNKGFRISLWQTPCFYDNNSLLTEKAVSSSFLVLNKNNARETASDFVDESLIGVIDFTNPEAVRWYKKMLRKLLEMGASVIKADFGERVPKDTSAFGMHSDLLHNLYSLLYQKAAFEITKKITGEGIIWARAGWAGSQRYPVHWGGDAAASWDGLAATIRGGLHLGCSGFAFWSHDIPGFHTLPDFMNSPVSDDLYVRWTQFGVFTSHMRYHGTSPREPYNFPAVADIVRRWLRLRYCLIPYLLRESAKCVKTGYPVLRALIFHHEDDPVCWHVDDQYYFGDVFIAAPVINSEGVRDIYLPEGAWTDFWTGEVVHGPKMLKNVKSDLSRMPVYAKTGSVIKVYPEIVQCTDEMDPSKTAELRFDNKYHGLSASFLGKILELQ